MKRERREVAMKERDEGGENKAAMEEGGEKKAA
jgi:hypothetical protein